MVKSNDSYRHLGPLSKWAYRALTCINSLIIVDKSPPEAKVPFQLLDPESGTLLYASLSNTGGAAGSNLCAESVEKMHVCVFVLHACRRALELYQLNAPGARACRPP